MVLAQTVDALARDFPAPGLRWEHGPGGLPCAVITTERGRARLTVHGAHACEWTPAGQTISVLFLSPHATFAPGRAIRGGVPVCFPWFASHPTDPGKPSHGFARTRAWQVVGVGRDEAGDLALTLRLAADDHTRALWAAEFVASLRISLGPFLALTLTVENRDDRPFTYEAALHTYLAVGDVGRIAVRGLEHTRFLDKVDAGRWKRSDGAPITFPHEVDRVYVDTTATCLVEDPLLGRRIQVDKHGSLATVIWSPGLEKGPAIADLREAWRAFVCVETASCGPHAIRLSPGEAHGMSARVSVAAGSG